MNGYFVPLGGGDPIPLLKERIMIGRRPDCDIRLAFSNVSGRHCELRFDSGSWVVKDLHSTNGVKVNGIRVEKKRLVPGDEVTIARRHHYRIQFEIEDHGAYREDEEDDNILSAPLLERAGLQKPARPLELDSDILDEDESPLEPDEKGKHRRRYKL